MDNKIQKGKKRYGYESEKISSLSFWLMCTLFRLTGRYKKNYKYLDEFGIEKGFTVVDYGCGPGGYLPYCSDLVGESGIVYGVDVQELAMKYINELKIKYNLKNVFPVLAKGYTTDIPDSSVDLIYALDMFHMIKDSSSFLKSLRRLIKPNGILIIEDGHQPRELSKVKILNSNFWEILEENNKFMRCRAK